MLISTILFLSALPPNYVEEQISKMERCVFSWTIVEISTEKLQDKCYYFSNSLYVLWDTWILKVNTRISNSLCFIDWFSVIYGLKNFPKIWDKVDFLLWNWTLISNIKNWEWSYIINWSLLGNISEWNFNVCEPNATEKDLELAKKKTTISKYLYNLNTEKPRTAKKLQTTLEDLNLSSLNQDTNILVLYAREILKMLTGNL
jgi:hypothetical protein